MEVGKSKKISAASARAHTRARSKLPSSSFSFSSGIFTKLIGVLLIGFSAWAYQATRPPPAKICGSEDGPPITAPRIKLSDGRHLAYKEYGVSKDKARYKIVFVHAFDSCRHDAMIATELSKDVVEDLGVYILSFDRPGYGESDPNPKQTLKSLSSDIEELADNLGLGSKFYMVGFSMGGQAVWTCLKYIPHRLAGATLIAPPTNYWWPGLPANVSEEGFKELFPCDQWAFRVSHYTPWLTYWWNTQNFFPKLSLIDHSLSLHSRHDLELGPKLASRKGYEAQVRQQGDYVSIHRDLNMGFGKWEFNPTDLDTPFPNNEGLVHIWQGDEDKMVPVSVQRYIAKQLPWIKYHEIPGGGHLFLYADGMADNIIKSLLTGES